MEQDQIRYLGDVQRLTLKPGDVLVLSVEGAISMECAERIKSYMTDVLPDHKVIVLGDGIKIGVLGEH